MAQSQQMLTAQKSMKLNYQCTMILILAAELDLAVVDLKSQLDTLREQHTVVIQEKQVLETKLAATTAVSVIFDVF